MPMDPKVNDECEKFMESLREWEESNWERDKC